MTVDDNPIGCPFPLVVAGDVRCGCPGDWQVPRHWLYQGVRFHCRCGPRQHFPGSDIWWEADGDGYACWACAVSLPERSRMRRLNCDMWCCWCGGPAAGNHGWRVYGHPANASGGTVLQPAEAEG